MTFWLNEPEILLKSDFNVIPNKKMTLDEKLNTIFRLGIVVSIVMMILTSNVDMLSIGIITTILTIVINLYYNKKRESFYGYDKCTKPTYHNPFMNHNIFDVENQHGACNIDYAHEEIAKAFNKGSITDANDIYGNQGGHRQFYTMPSSTIVNDRDTLGKWLYDRGPSCKDGNGDKCMINLNLHRTDLLH